MIRVASLAAVLFVFWLLLSGHFTPFLVVSGAISALLIAWLGVALGYADEEGHPVEWIGRGLIYWPWLIKEAIKSAIDVSLIVVNPAPVQLAAALSALEQPRIAETDSTFYIEVQSINAALQQLEQTIPQPSPGF